jgi:hypothetical protein
MEHFKTLKLNLPKKWIDISDENSEGTPTFVRKEWNKNPGVLQISVVESEVDSNLKHKDLIILAKEFDSENEFDLLNTKSGHCQLGLYGYAEFKNKEFPFISVWNISDTKNIIFSTYISSEKQMQSDIDEVYDIIKNIKHKK